MSVSGNVPRAAGARLRIGVVAHAGLGGSGTVATELAVALAARGHQLHMITPQRPFRLAERCDVKVHELALAPHPMWESPPWSLALAGRIAEVSATHQLDVLHAHFAVPYAAATEWACQILGPDAPPWIATLHGSDVAPLGREPAYRGVVQHAVRRADRVTVPSRQLRDLALRELGVKRSIDVIANFVSGDRFRPAADRQPPSIAGATFVHVSNFRPVKRVGDVVAIFAALAQRGRCRLLLVGDGPERAGALEQLAALGLSDRVEAPGAQRNIEAWLARAHVALLPSERESFGLAALEALASGVPVVGSAVGGLPEVVEHGETGFLAPVGAVAAMASAAAEMVADDARWAAMARTARARALTRFSTEQALDGYEALYRAAIAEPKHHRRH